MLPLRPRIPGEHVSGARCELDLERIWNSETQSARRHIADKIDNYIRRVTENGRAPAADVIDVLIAVDVPDFHTPTMRHDEWLLARIGWRYHFGIAREDCVSFWSGQFRPDSRLSIGVFGHVLI